MKIPVFLATSFLFFSFFSCSSSKIVVPGESKIIYRNISEEYFAIAETYKGQANYDKAIEYYTLALSNKELHDSAFYEIALCQVYAKKWAPAKKSFTKLLKKDPENASLKMSLAYIQAMCGNLNKAEKMYEAICAQRPDDSEPLVNYINVLIEEKKYDTALEKLNFLEQKFPDDENIDSLKKKITELTEDKESQEGKKSDSETMKNPEAGKDDKTPDEDLFGLIEENKENKDEENQKDSPELSEEESSSLNKDSTKTEKTSK